MKFPYIGHPSYSPLALPQKKVIFRPQIPVIVKHKNKTISLACIVDSGADYNIFPSRVGKFLGIDVYAGDREMIKGIGGQVFTVYYHKVEMIVANKSFEAIAAFGDQIKFPVLGQEGFFDKFEVKFNYQKKEIEIKPL